MLLTLAALVLLAAPPPPPEVHSETLPDGSGLLVVPGLDSGRISLRWVVAAGASHDPVGKAGLAHVLEHLVFHGTYEAPPLVLEQAVRRAGGTLNAYTMAQATVYVLDAPTEAFGPLAARFLRSVSNPALSLAQFERELAVVDVEGALAGSQFALKNELDAMLFPSLDQTMTVRGSKNSRKAIRLQDVTTWYATHYHAANTTAVFTGDIGVATARRLMEENSCLPPRKPLPPSRAASAPPRLPLELKARSGLTFALFGFVLDQASALPCQTAAALLERRLRTELMVTDPVVSAVSVGCMRFRGLPTLLATTFSTGLDASHLAEVLEEQFEALGKTSPTGKELQAARRHLEAQRAKVLESPPQLADLISLEIADGERDLKAVLEWVAPQGVPTAEMSRSLARKSFQADSRVFVLFSPFDGEY